MTLRLLAYTLLSSLVTTYVFASTSWTANPVSPAAIPLAVRSPYLSAWLLQGQGAALTSWPTFWTGMIVGWAGYINVDGQPYVFLGAPGVPAQKAVQKSVTITPTQTVFVMEAGAVDVTVTFLSPVEPGDLVKQSFPFSYMSLVVSSTDGVGHLVKVYSDISAEWISGNLSLVANWTTSTNNNIITHQVQLADQQPFTEVNDRTQYGSAFYSLQQRQGVTYQTGQDVVVRTQFVTKATLLNSQDTSFRGVSDKWPVFAMAADLGEVTGPSEPVVFSVGHVRDPAIQYIKPDGTLQNRSLLFWSEFDNIGDAISSFVDDFPNATARADAIDSQINNDARNISLDYSEILSLSLRQAFAGSEITVSKASDGSFNKSDILIFTKEISSSGRINTVDATYSAWPLYLYANATFGKYALLPILEYQASGQYPKEFTVHDLGTHYPLATGHNDENVPEMPIEECGNMLIMALSYTQRTGDNSLITTYFSLLDQWAQYLVNNSLTPSDQLSSDAFAGSLPKQSNLAIKGIIGIKAMSEIANFTGDSTRSQHYSQVAAEYASQFQKLATSSDGHHLTLQYGSDSSWTLAYNLYADKLLNLNVFPESIYSMQSSWYGSVANQFGVQLDSRNNYSLSHWEIWAAATASSTTVRDKLIGSVLDLAADGKSNKPFGDWYDTIAGTTNAFAARPVIGGHFALLGLTGAPLNTSAGIPPPPATTIPLVPGPPNPTSPNPNDASPSPSLPTSGSVKSIPLNRCNILMTILFGALFLVQYWS